MAKPTAQKASARATPPKGGGSTNWVRLAGLPVVLGALILANVAGVRDRLGLSKPPTPTVTIRQGTILGRMVDDGTFPKPLEGFMGIPYALPPVDNLRFRPAVPVPSSNQTFEAYYLGPRLARLYYLLWECIQLISL